MKWRDIPTLFKEAAYEWINDNAPRMGAALAYYTMFALAPLLVIVVAVAGAMFGAEAVNGRIAEQLQSFVGKETAGFIQSMVAKAGEPKSGTFATVSGVVVLIFGAMGLFGELQGAMNTIWKVQPRPSRGVVTGFLRDRLLSFCMVLGSALLLFASLALTTVVAALGKNMASWNAVLGGHALTLLVSWVLVTLLFAMVYRFLPDVIVPWREVWFGAIVTSLLFSLGKLLIGLYLGHAGVGSVYGAAGSLAVLLVWLYYSAQIFLYGAELTKVYAKRYGLGIVPAANAVAIECKPVEEDMHNGSMRKFVSSESL